MMQTQEYLGNMEAHYDHIRTYTYTRTLTHAHTLSLSLSLSLSHTHTHNLSVSLSHTHAHTHTCTQTHTRIHESTQIHKCIYDMLILCERSWRAGQSILSNYSHSPIANIGTIIASACMCVSICINRYIHIKYICIIYMYTIHMLYTICIYYIIHCGIHLRKICDCCCPTADRTVRHYLLATPSSCIIYICTHTHAHTHTHIYM